MKIKISPSLFLCPTIILPFLCSVLVLITGCQTQKVADASKESAQATATTAPESHVQKMPEFTRVVRIKAGLSAPFTDHSGSVWLADQGFEGGDTIERDPGTVISGTSDPALFLSEHYGMNSFSCKLSNGKYVAKLYFAETFDGITGPGARVFSFNVQGHEFKDFDVWVKAGGPNKAYVETVPVDVTNGVFRIDFMSNIENPEINAIEIIPAA